MSTAAAATATVPASLSLSASSTKGSVLDGGAGRKNDTDDNNNQERLMQLNQMLSRKGSSRGGGIEGGGQQVEEHENKKDPLLDKGDTDAIFSVVNYLNLALSMTPSTSSSADDTQQQQQQQWQQQRLAELALQLQVETSHCHETIGRVSAELQAIVPRCGSDITRLGVGLNALREDAATLLQASTTRTTTTSEVQGVAGATVVTPPSAVSNDKTSPSGADNGGGVAAGAAASGASSAPTTTTATTSLETLSTLHNLQSGLTRTQHILTALSAWDDTVRSIPLQLSQNQLERAVHALEKLDTYRQQLHGMSSGSTERQHQNDKARQQVMDMLAPVLQNAVSVVVTSNGRMLQPIQHCVNLYSRLGALHVLQSEYVKNRPSHVHKLWFQFDVTKDRMDTWIPTWLDAVYQLVSDEIRQSTAVFGGVGSSSGSGSGSGGVGSADPSSSSTSSSASAAAFSSPTLPLATTIRVLHECFRPLRASWSSRLEATCSSYLTRSSTNNSTAGAAHKDDWEGLCAVYESILQFLSMVYGTIVGSYQDLQESGLLVGVAGLDGSAAVAATQDNKALSALMSPAQLHKELSNAFVAVAAPFAAYQERFAMLENAHASRLARAIETDMRAVLTKAAIDGNDDTMLDDTANPAIEDRHSFPPRSITLEGLSRAVEGLVQESSRMFEVADGSLERYELLLGGYAASESVLKPVDAVVSAHLNDLSTLVSTLTSLTRESLLSSSSAGGSGAGGGGAGDVSHWHLDESVVTASLQVLHVAGTVVRRCNEFKSHARQRVKVWTERLASQLDGVGESASARTVTLSDSMSPADVDSIVARSVSVAVFRQDATTALSILQKLITNDSSSTESQASLFPKIEASVANVCRACQIQVFDTCSTVPLRHLAGMSSLSCWRSASSAGGGSEYGILPQSYMTQVGEHMLSLVQALEPFASNPEALALAHPVMSGVHQVAVTPWKEFVEATGSAVGNLDDDPRRDSVLLQLMDGSLFSAHREGQGDRQDGQLDDASAVNDEEKADPSDVDPGDASAESGAAVTAFCNAWLDAVGCAVTGRLLERILRIPSLSPKGCEHLHADLTYLVNVLTALDVAGHPHPLLLHVAELACADGAELSERIARREAVGGIGKEVGASSAIANSCERVLWAVEERVAAIRGVAARYNY